MTEVTDAMPSFDCEENDGEGTTPDGDNLIGEESRTGAVSPRDVEAWPSSNRPVSNISFQEPEIIGGTRRGEEFVPVEKSESRDKPVNK